MIDQQENLKQAAEKIRDADALLITAGAGMGVDSGLPDFRGNTGFWKAYPPIARLGIPFSEMANPMWFYEKPKLAWAFYGHRLNMYRNTKPHDGFYQLLEFAALKPAGYFVFTSNVDGHFEQSGFSKDRIEECHGSIHHFQCTGPCSDHIWPADGISIDIDESVFEALDPLPLCPYCHQLARPNILMFGDWNWIESRTRSQHLRMNQWLMETQITRKSLCIIEIGAGTAVATVRYTSEQLADRYGATLVRINPRDYQVPYGHISIPFGAREGIGNVLDSLK